MRLAVPLPSLAQPVAIPGSVIAASALRYVGKGYTYGGNASAPGDWDCSSFVSYVLGHDLRLALPGGKWGDPGYPPNAHGPVVLDYASWPGAITVNAPVAGDLCVWAGAGPNGHIGIAVNSSEMVSALNSQQGTVRTPIAGYGPSGVALTYRRLINAVAGTMPVSSSGGTGKPPLVAVLLIAGLFAAGWLLVLAAASLAGVAVVAGARKAAQS
jgi:hypothetical protein